ncbi:MAG: SigE family RNA polymerase sigma factor [Actinobacteria bacterium]|nr:SigE family RNA polymerase sigma factor [Actinomycetota bacterium]
MDHGARSPRPCEPADVGADDDEFLDVVSDELPRMQRVARLLTGGAESADDLVAEAIARTLPRWRNGDVADGPAYLRRVVVNLATRRWRRRAIASRRDHAALDWVQPAPSFDSLAAERDRTLRAVLRLPARRRAVVVLRFYEDLPEAAIADILGVEVGTVKSQLSRALEQLRADLGTLDGA